MFLPTIHHSICLILALVSGMFNGTWATVTRSTILEDIFRNYDRGLSPKYNRTGFDQQVVVQTNLYVLSMYSISEANMEYSMSLFLRERWLDERLKFDNVLNLTRLELEVTAIDDVWKPDMFIYNEKMSQFHSVTVPNKLLHIYPDGTVQFSMRVTGTFTCQMFLQKYPFDTQECYFQVESYGHSTETMKFVWSEGGGVTIAEGIEFPQFRLIKTKSYTCDKEYYGIVFSCIGVRFLLERDYSYYITQIYVPSILIVLLSWVNFWLDPSSVPARISLAVLTVLTMTTQSSGVRANLSQVSYVKAIDVWMATCLTFVFLGLIEFALVNVKTREATKRKLQEQNNNVSSVSLTEGEAAKMKAESVIQIGSTPSCRLPCARHFEVDPARRIDKMSRWMFPLAFLLFNAAYWAFYLNWVPDIPLSPDKV